LSLLACEEPPEAARFAACVASEHGFPTLSALYYGVELELGGLVTETGTGEPPLDCLRTAVAEWPARPDDAWWVRLLDSSGVSWTLGVWLPDGGPGPEVDDLLSARFTYLEAPFASDIGEMELLQRDGALLVWVGVGGDLPDLSPPAGITLAQGGRAGRVSSQCGSWVSYDLEATVGAELVTLPPGAVATAGDYELRHGGFSKKTRDSNRCQDGPGGSVAVAIRQLP
jgi:hypothetical protein